MIEVHRGGGAGTVPAALVFEQRLADAVGGVTVEDDFVLIPEGIDARFVGSNPDIEIDEVVFGLIDWHGGKIGIVFSKIK